MITEKWFCVVRMAESEYHDLGTLASSPQFARERAVHNEQDNQVWAKANPVIRVAELSIREVRA